MTSYIATVVKNCYLSIGNFNTVLRRCVACINSSLLLKIQWREHHYLYEHGCYSVQTFSHVVIMTQKLDPHAQRGAGY
jgi:hypothetical protein